MNNHPPVAIIHRQSNFSCATNMCHQIISTRFLPATLEDSTDIPISEEEYTQLGVAFKDSSRTLWPCDLERLKQMNCPPPKYTRPRLAKGLRQDYMRLCRSEYMTIFRRPLSRITPLYGRTVALHPISDFSISSVVSCCITVSHY